MLRQGTRALKALATFWCAMLLFGPQLAHATVPELLFQVPEASQASGPGSEQLNNPRGIAADPISGHFYVSDGNNARISEYTSWGIFVKAWGWGVADGSSEALQTCTTKCFKGLKGSGPGEFGFPQGVAVDSAGSVYVVDEGNQRVQKFSSSGDLLLMFGGEVNKTDNVNICTQADLESGDICGAGKIGGGPGEFETMGTGLYLDVGPGDVVYVGDRGRIQKFNSSGSFVGQISFSDELSTASVRALAVDSEGNVFVAFQGFGDIRKFDGFGNLIETLPARTPTALATDVLNGVYAIDHDPEETAKGVDEVIRYGSDGVCTICIGDRFARPPAKGDLSHPSLNGVATNLIGDGTTPGDVYVSFFGNSISYVNAYGPRPQFEPAPARAPLIQGQSAGPVGTTTASLSAEINPRFFESTTYYVEYGTSPCDLGGCTTLEPAPPGNLLGFDRNAYFRSAPVEVEGLEPGTTYYFRFVAISDDLTSKGEGKDSEGKPLEEEATFTTFREGIGMLDGRAYELVSPADKENGEVGSPEPSSGLVSTTVAPQQAALSGEGLTYTSFTAFGEDPQSAPAASQYLSHRTASGWQTNNITPADRESFLADPLRGFSPELDWGAVVQVDPPLVPGAAQAFENLYVQDTDTETYELVTEAEPEIAVPQTSYCAGFAGATDDFSHVLLTARGALREGDPVAAGQNLYEWVRGEGLRLVSVLPSGNPAAPLDATAFGAAGNECKAGAIAKNAISADGEVIFWTRGTSPTQLLARIGGTATVQLDKNQGGTGPAGGGRFWAASDDGSVVYFTAPGKLVAGAGTNDLYRYDFSLPEGSRLSDVAKGGEVQGVLAASEDGARVYFVGGGVLDPEEGPTGEVAEAGKPNLYLFEEGGGARFIGVLTAKDETDWFSAPNGQTARTTPDGSALAFLSRNSLTGYDNRGQSGGGAPASEVFLYSATEDALRCASCNPTGSRPLGDSAVPGWWTPYEQPRYLSDSGGRVFFESSDALDPRDQNGKQDVYEFELAGEGGCEEESPTYVPANGGCLALVSSGAQEGDSLLIDASPTGTDVFFSTPERLTWEDVDQRYDIYDARIGGGFPEPPPPPDPCEGEACHGPAQPAPATPAPPASSQVSGAGNVKEAKPKPKPKPKHCKKGYRKVKKKGKVRCVKKHAKHKKGSGK